MKNLIIITIFSLSALTLKAQTKEKPYKVLASCGTCNFGMSNENGCSLAIQMAGKHYWVDGSTLQDHGDEHAENGMCKTTRKAKVFGHIEGDTIYTSKFILIK